MKTETYPNLCAAKAVVTGKFITINAHIKILERFNKQSNFTSKGTIKQIKPKVSRRKEIITE